MSPESSSPKFELDQSLLESQRDSGSVTPINQFTDAVEAVVVEVTIRTDEQIARRQSGETEPTPKEEARKQQAHTEQVIAAMQRVGGRRLAMKSRITGRS